MYSITLNPEFDTHHMLNAYAKSFDIQPGWFFLTGTVAETDIIRRKLGFASLDPVTDKDPVQHTGMIRIGNARLDRWCMMPGLMSAKQIAGAVRNLA
jgi:protein SCO1/2